jgi:serum/glucocorticoid-regulated kinase 2
MLRKSRSLGEGLLSLFAAGDRQELAPAVPTTSPSLDSPAAPVLPPISPIQGSRDSTDLTRKIDREVIAMGTEDTETRSPQPEAETPAPTEASGAEAIQPDEKEAEAHAESDVATIVPLEPSIAAARVVESQPGEAMKRKRPGRKATSVDDFELIRVLGKGCAGKVRRNAQRIAVFLDLTRSLSIGGTGETHKDRRALCDESHHETSRSSASRANPHACKLTNRAGRIGYMLTEDFEFEQTEQSVLRRMSSTELSNPFIVKLWWSFHDVDNLYLVLDFLPGGDLATQLSRWGRLGRDRARFYTCEIVEGVEALHAAGIIYRDLKPGM